MKRQGTILAAVSVAVAAACRSGGPPPHEFLPADSDVLLSLAPPSEAGPGLSAVLDRIPEGDGVLDLLSSLTGIDMRDGESTLASGIDPDRGVAAAFWEDGALFILPLSDEELGERRLRLRLARMGFVPAKPAVEGVTMFESTRGAGFPAGLRTGGGLAFVCLGRLEGCEPGRQAAAWDPGATAAELAMRGSLLVGVVRGGPVGRALDAAGIRGSAKAVAAALIRDVRFAVAADKGIRLRALAGPPGDPVKPMAEPAPPPEGVAAIAAVHLPPALTGKAAGDSVAGMMGMPRAAALRALVSSWTGDAVVAVMDDEAAAPAPLVMDSRLLERLDLAGVAEFADEGAAASAARLLGGLFVTAGLIEASPSGRNVIVGSRGARDRGLRLERSGTLVLHASVDPALLLRSLGGGGVEFVRHVVDAVSNVYVDFRFGAGRPMLEAGILVR